MPKKTPETKIEAKLDPMVSAAVQADDRTLPITENAAEQNAPIKLVNYGDALPTSHFPRPKSRRR